MQPSKAPSLPCDRKYAHATHPSYKKNFLTSDFFCLFLCLDQTAGISAPCCFFLSETILQTCSFFLWNIVVVFDLNSVKKDSPGLDLSSSVEPSESLPFEAFFWLKGWSLLECLAFPPSQPTCFTSETFIYIDIYIYAKFSIYFCLFWNDVVEQLSG